MSATFIQDFFSGIFEHNHYFCIFPSTSFRLSLSSFACNPFSCPSRSRALSYRSLSLFSILVVISSLRRRCWWGLDFRLGFRYLLRWRRASVHTAKSSASYRCNTYANESEKLRKQLIVSSRNRTSILPQSFFFQECKCLINMIY